MNLQETADWIVANPPCPQCREMVPWTGSQPFNGQAITVEPQCGRCG